jgi:hypothetical protein
MIFRIPIYEYEITNDAKVSNLFVCYHVLIMHNAAPKKRHGTQFVQSYLNLMKAAWRRTATSCAIRLSARR